MGVEGEQAPDSEAPRALGRTLAGRYRIQSVLGEGGMALVYEGEHVAIGKRVAIKLMQSFFARDTEVVQRFEHEARTASAVESEHIVQVFDAGADPDLGLFLVMELLKGEDLARVLARERKLDPLFACGIVAQAALGLEKAHAAGIVHRDLKPANVFLVERDDGTTLVKLVDFGIAKIARHAQDARFARGITRQGTAIGTPQYMSPEQAQALDSVDHRTDVYSLGAVLFEAIAGEPHLPERPTYEQTILQLVSTPAPRLSTLWPDAPPALDDLIADMLERDVSRRVPDMRTVRERIVAIHPRLREAGAKLKSLRPTSGGYSRVAPTLPRTSAASGLPRRGRSLVLVAGLAVVLGTGVGLTTMSRRPRVAPIPVSQSAPAGTEKVLIAASAGTPDPPSLTEATSEPSSARAAPPPAAPASSRASPATPPHATPHRTPSPSAPAPKSPVEQVGAAGISSQF